MQTKAANAISALRVADEIFMRKPSRNVFGADGLEHDGLRFQIILTMDWGGNMSLLRYNVTARLQRLRDSAIMAALDAIAQ
jgi:hypothetical protein